MLFKGTQRRSAYSIAKEIDSVGGVLNAFTSKEMTSFYCRVLNENLQLAVDLLGDLFLNPSFPDDEIEREKQVVCQEIAQLEDSPEDLVHEILGIRFWWEDPLGQPILGTIQNIENFDRDILMGFKQDNYLPQETVVCAAGNVNHSQFVDLFGAEMARVPRGSAQLAVVPAASTASAHVMERDLEQVHVCFAAVAPSAVDDRRHAAYILNTILGGGMSSRLFQEVREKRGLAYTVYSFISSFSDTGMFGVYAASDPERLEELMTVIGRETTGIVANLTDEDIRTAKQQIRGNVILAMESSESRMNRLAKGEYYFGRYVPTEEIISAIERVTLDELKETARQIIDPERFTIVALGPVSESLDLKGMFAG